jgi:hypothetical protein
MNKDHDAQYKEHFSNPTLVSELLRTFVNEDFVKQQPMYPRHPDIPVPTRFSLLNRRVPDTDDCNLLFDF